MKGAMAMQTPDLKPCPICGDKHRRLCRTVLPRRWKKYWIECWYCHFCTSPAATKWGARRKWNKSKNWRLSNVKTHDLKPCPFCGGKAELKAYLIGGIKAWAVHCKKAKQDLSCCAQMTSIKSEEDAINAWNRRVNDENI